MAQKMEQRWYHLDDKFIDHKIHVRNILKVVLNKYLIKTNFVIGKQEKGIKRFFSNTIVLAVLDVLPLENELRLECFIDRYTRTRIFLPVSC